jgi:hypothetical protein
MKRYYKLKAGTCGVIVGESVGWSRQWAFPGLQIIFV